MMLSYLVIAALMPAMVLSFIGKVPAPTHAAGHHIEEQNPYMPIAKELGDLWSKLLLARVVSENSDFSGDSSTAAEKVQELADEISNHNNMNIENMKYVYILTEMETLKRNWGKPGYAKSDMHYKPSDSKIAEYVNEMVKISQEIVKKMDSLPDSKHAKNGDH
ncbi:hypothetical protein Ddc_16545 [Ditylenchus destructor]|nr:hypothetical protein Ddc_16545 [Ditylenchus destructor]